MISANTEKRFGSSKYNKTMQLQKIKVDELKLSDIVNEIEHGQLRIPRFQRDFVWERSKVIKLLDSIYKEYPIGSLFTVLIIVVKLFPFR